MAETLPTLIKLAERRVEDAQRELSRTRVALEAVRNDMAECELQIAKAFKDAEGSAQVLNLQAAVAFKNRMTREIAQLRELERGLEVQVAAVMERLQAVFAEQKRYEILHERKELAAKKRQDKKRQAQMDEAGQKRGGV